jgi:general secretion pathway protein A
LVLAGQPELAERLERNDLRQLKQRITLRCELTPFEVTDTAGYIAGRIKTAGGIASRMFTQEAVLLIHERSKGIARSINVICDNALIGAMALGQTRVDRAMVIEVCRDLRLNAASTASVDLSPSSRQPVVDEPAPLQPAESEPAADPAPSGGGVSRIFRFPFRFGAGPPVQRVQQNGR